MDTGTGVGFTGLVDLAAAKLGGKALYANDEFFAPKEAMLEPGRGVFIPDKYTDRGKWMDGWESRRKRVPGHDFCLVKLGLRGIVRGVDIDTNHFLGNHPPHASIDFVDLAGDPSVDELNGSGTSWKRLLAKSPLRPGSQNIFVIPEPSVVSHVRLNIFPDGGVARFRLYGDVVKDLSAMKDQTFDLAAFANGGKAVACSDMFFGAMDNLIMPNRGINMGDGWETKRKRVPGNDWIVVKLAARGTLETVEVDTHHFKGNYPDRCSLEAIDLGADVQDPAWDKLDWVEVLPQSKLEADRQHPFSGELKTRGPFTHVRLSIYPDGGVSRLRVNGRLAPAGGR